ncbi:MAG: T9SS type A sorting domain-containing protein, partial [Bacteroidia bacterium]
TTSSVPLNAQSVKVIHTSSGQINVVGNYYDANATISGVFVASFTQAGVPIVVAGFQVSSAPNSGIFAESACLSGAAGSNVVYVTGVSREANIIPGNGGGPFAFAVDMTSGTFLWSQLYDFGHITTASKRIPRDIIESPYTPAFVNEVVIVGTNYNGIGMSEGFLFRVDANTGIPITGTSEIYMATTDVEINSISRASGFGAGSDGFVLGGNIISSNNGTFDYWLTKVDQTGNQLWSNSYEYSTGFEENMGTDVMERLNTFGVWEYYFTGNVFNSSISGSDDIVVLKIDDASGAGLNEYTYQGNGGERPVEIVAQNTAAIRGFVVFGNRANIATTNELMIRAYYNGVTPGACPVTPAAPVTITPGIVQQTVLLPNFNSLVVSQLLIAQSTNLTAFAPCTAVTVPGGSNARIANEETEVEQTPVVSIFPNPVSVNSSALQLKLVAPQTGEVQLRITDMLGREVITKTIIAAEGESIYPVELPKTLTAGLYSISITGAGVNEVQRFVVE